MGLDIYAGTLHHSARHLYKLLYKADSSNMEKVLYIGIHLLRLHLCHEKNFLKERLSPQFGQVCRVAVPLYFCNE